MLVGVFFADCLYKPWMFVTVRKVWQVVVPVQLDAQVVLVQACLAVALSTAAYAGLHAYNRQSRRGRFQIQH